MKAMINSAKLFALTVLSMGILSAAFVPSPTYAQSQGVTCNEYFLTFPAWYRGLVDKGSCNVLSPTDPKFGGEDERFAKYAWTIGLNVVEIILNLVGYATVAFIIYGGYKYMTSAGSPDGMVSARKTITNAIIGLVISVAAVAIVRTVASGLGGVG